MGIFSKQFAVLQILLAGSVTTKIIPGDKLKNPQAFVDGLVAQLRGTKNADMITKFEFYFNGVLYVTRGSFASSKVYKKAIKPIVMSSVLEMSGALNGYIGLPSDEIEDHYDELKRIITDIVSDPAYWQSVDQSDFINNVIEENSHVLGGDSMVMAEALEFVEDTLFG